MTKRELIKTIVREWRSFGRKVRRGFVFGTTRKAAELLTAIYGFVRAAHARKIELNRILVEDGLAWAYRQYSSDYADAKDEARLAQVGIWQAATEPAWEFRHKSAP